MKQNNLDGTIQPALGKKDQATKNKTYKKPNGEAIVMTPDEFKKIVEIFDYLRKVRDSQNARPDTLEPSTCTHLALSHVERLAG